MRRAAASLVCVALAALGFALVGGQARAGGDYRVDVILDNAHGLVPGQLVEIAGARVGKIDDVVLTPDFKARVELTVQAQYAPFHKDANCTIRPQGLIAEYYVDCDPGTPDSPELQSSGANAPTVPVGQTTAPVAITDLFDIWTVPVRERLTVLLSELGISTAARGEDFNALLRRANPALAQARRVIGILHRQKGQLATILDTTHDAIGRLAAKRRRVSDFIDKAAAVTSQTGLHSSELAQGVARLPALLDAAKPALRDLNGVVRTGTPLVRRLHQAAPALNRISVDIGPFARTATPTLAKLKPVLEQGTRTLRASAPISRLLRGYAHRSLPAAKLAGPLFTDLDAKGFNRSLMLFLYRGAALGARFDGVSHILPSFITLNACAAPATTPVAGCSANFTQPTLPAARHRARRHHKAPQPSAPQAPAIKAPEVKPPALKVPAPLAKPIESVQKLIQKLLPPAAPQSPSTPDKPVDRLLGYLLG